MNESAKPGSHAWGAAASNVSRRVARRLQLVVLALAAALAASVSAQPVPAQGRLLVATPDIGDPSWAETVLLVLHHDSNGSLGVAINRPTRVPPQEVAPSLDTLAGYEGSVFRGGPVGPTQMIFLVRNPPAGLLESAPMILDGVYAAGDLSALPELVEAVGSDAVRLYAGHVEWAPGQLEQEIANGRWNVVDGSAERVFSEAPDRLWRLLQALGNELLVRGAPTGAAGTG